MGGFGSGGYDLQYVKTTIEECDALDINWMIREGIFDRRKPSRGVYTITGNRGYVSSLTYFLRPNAHKLDLSYTFKGEAIDYSIPLSQSTLPWGGKRWWMHCPLLIKGVPCKRRVAKLWRPRYSRYFGCRHCHDLTYYLCQHSHQRDTGYRGELAPPHWPIAQQFRHDMLEDYKSEKWYMNYFERNEQRRLRRKAKHWS